MPTTQVTEITSSVDAIAARTDSAGAAVTPDWAAEERRMDHETGFPGVIEPADSYQVVAGAAATMNIVVGSGTAKTDLALVQGNIGGQGMYLVRLDEVTVTIALDAADPSDPRIDEVYLVVYDNIYDSTSRSLPRLAVRKGDAAASPSLPGADAAWEAFLLLSEITIPAAAADILAATFVDKRVNARPMNHQAQHLPGGPDPVSFLVPTGAILPYGGSSAPTDYLLCDGSSYTTASRLALFNIIGYAYGGSGANFNVPDMRQRFPLGKATSGTGATLGDTAGSIDHKHTMPTHVHGHGTHIHTMPTHSHADGSYAAAGGGSHDHAGDTGTKAVGHTHILVFEISGSSQGFHTDSAHTPGNSPKRHFIDGAGDSTGPDTDSGTTTTHDHSIGVQANHTHDITGTSGSTDPGNTNATDPGNTDATDPGDTNTENPPLLTVEYIIKT